MEIFSVEKGAKEPQGSSSYVPTESSPVTSQTVVILGCKVICRNLITTRDGEGESSGSTSSIGDTLVPQFWWKLVVGSETFMSSTTP